MNHQESVSLHSELIYIDLAKHRKCQQSTKLLSLLSRRKLQKGLPVFTNTVLSFISAKTDRNLFVYNRHLTTTSAKQLKFYCLEIREIKTMKFIKCLTAWFQIRKTLQLQQQISRRSNLTVVLKSCLNNIICIEQGEGKKFSGM